MSHTWKYGAMVDMSAELMVDAAGISNHINNLWHEWALDQIEGPRFGPPRPTWTRVMVPNGRPAGPYRRRP